LQARSARRAEEGAQVLLSLWSPKGGSGTSVLAAACAVVLARQGPGARLVDLGGDQPAILGLASDPLVGVADWLAAGPEAPAEALDRLIVEAYPGLVLIPSGRGAPEGARPEAGAALAVALAANPSPVVADCGLAADPATRALVECADVALVVVRGCYLALRRAVRADLLHGTAGVVVIEEPGRSLGAGEVADVLGRPVVARVGLRPTVARAVDAGVLVTRLPVSLASPVTELLRWVDALGQRGEAA